MEWPKFLNHHLRVIFYNGEAYSQTSKIENVLSDDTKAHYSMEGTSFDLLLESKQSLYLSHFSVGLPQSCTSPIHTGAVYLSSTKPETFSQSRPPDIRFDVGYLFQSRINLPFPGPSRACSYIHIKFLSATQTNFDISFFGFYGCEVEPLSVSRPFLEHTALLHDLHVTFVNADEAVCSAVEEHVFRFEGRPIEIVCSELSEFSRYQDFDCLVVNFSPFGTILTDGYSFPAFLCSLMDLPNNDEVNCWEDQLKTSFKTKLERIIDGDYRGEINPGEVLILPVAELMSNFGEIRLKSQVESQRKHFAFVSTVSHEVCKNISYLTTKNLFNSLYQINKTRRYEDRIRSLLLTNLPVEYAPISNSSTTGSREDKNVREKMEAISRGALQFALAYERSSLPLSCTGRRLHSTSHWFSQIRDTNSLSSRAIDLFLSRVADGSILRRGYCDPLEIQSLLQYIERDLEKTIDLENHTTGPPSIALLTLAQLFRKQRINRCNFLGCYLPDLYDSINIFKHLVKIATQLPTSLQVHSDIPPSSLVLGDCIGQGTSGKVYQATYLSEAAGKKLPSLSSSANSGRRSVLLAVKRIDVNAITFDEKELRREVVLLSLLSHPNLIRMYGAWTCTDEPYLVTAFARNGDLYRVIHSGFTPSSLGTVPPSISNSNSIVQSNNVFGGNPLAKTALPRLAKSSSTTSFAEIDSGEIKAKICSGIAMAMEYLHRMGVIHRDLKSLNVLLDETYTPLLTDFGVARMCSNVMTGGIGTIRWMAPEIMNGLVYSQSADVYSFAIVVWEILTRRVPYSEIGNDFQIAQNVSKGKRPPILPNVSSDLSNLLKSCWHSKSSKRPSFSQIVLKLKTVQFSATPSSPSWLSSSPQYDD